METEKGAYERLFDDFLSTIEFELVKYSDGWGLVDETGTNLGDIEEDRFDAAGDIIDRLGIYIVDYLVSDIAEELGIEGGWDFPAFLGRAKLMLPPEGLDHYSHELELLDMICNHRDDIDLEKCQFSVNEEEADEPKEDCF